MKYWRHILCINTVKSYKTLRSDATVSAILARLTTVTLAEPISACAARYSPAKVLVLLLSSLLSMLSGEIYRRLKPYLVVKISSDIVTEHCCHVCVLSMTFCRSAAVCWHGM